MRERLGRCGTLLPLRITLSPGSSSDSFLPVAIIRAMFAELVASPIGWLLLLLPGLLRMLALLGLFCGESCWEFGLIALREAISTFETAPISTFGPGAAETSSRNCSDVTWGTGKDPSSADNDFLCLGGVWWEKESEGSRTGGSIPPVRDTGESVAGSSRGSGELLLLQALAPPSTLLPAFPTAVPIRAWMLLADPSGPVSTGGIPPDPA